MPLLPTTARSFTFTPSIDVKKARRLPRHVSKINHFAVAVKSAGVFLGEIALNFYFFGIVVADGNWQPLFCAQLRQGLGEGLDRAFRFFTWLFSKKIFGNSIMD